MSRRINRGRGLRLSANPMDLQDPNELPYEEEPMMPEDELPYEEEPEDEAGMYKGRRVSGPRTKLASAGQVGRIEAAVVELAENQAAMARSIAGLAKAFLRKEDEDEEDEKEDKALRKGQVAKRQVRKQTESDFTPYGGLEDEGDPESQDPEESTMNEPGLQDPKGATELANARKALRKDDASSNFGEKDGDIPGNRPADIDEKDKPAEEYLIQGDAGDGPGPVSKALRAELDKAFDQVLAKHGIVKKAVGPAPGNSQVETGAEPDLDVLFDRARGMSFSELNAVRAASGDLPPSIF